MGTLDRVRKAVRPLGAVAGVTGAAALVNRSLRNTSPLPHDHIGGKRLPWTWRGYEIFATELGHGPTVMLVHGIYAGASSYEFRELAPLLAHTHRVVAFDLLGCGLSEMPDLDYSAELFVEQIVDAVGLFCDAPMTLVGSSLGGAYAVLAAQRAPDRVHHLVTICPTGVAGVLDGEPARAQRIVQAVFRLPLLGETAFNALASRGSLGYFLRKQSYADAGRVTSDVIDHYYALTHQPGARFVPAHFVGGALNCDVVQDLPFVEAPLLVIWGEAASRTNPVQNATVFARLARDARVETFAGTGLLPHEEDSSGVASAIADFISTSGAVASGEGSANNRTA